jgi:flagellar biosynthesis chaperone FliJ
MAETYRLSALLKLRLRAREEAEAELARAQTSQTKAKKQVEAAERFEQDCAAKVEAAKSELYAGESLTIALIQSREQFVKRLVVEHENAGQSVLESQELLEQAQEVLRQANQNLVNTKTEEEALLKHKEQWLKEQKVVRRRREEDEADDIAQSLWLRKK